jgi:tetratricopeptide (TPR) repeat protein
VELASVGIEAYQVMPARKNLYEYAAQEAGLLLNRDPDSFDGHRLRGDVLVIDRKYADALAEFQKANAVRPNDPNVILALARILFGQNRDREGEQAVQQFLAVRKDFSPIYDVLETHYVKTRRLADAERLLQSEIAAFPKNARPRLQLASLYRASGRSRELSQELAKITGDRANFPDGPLEVGDFYAEFRQWDEALQQYRAGIQTSPNKKLYHQRMERSFEALGRRDEAIGEFSAILKDAPNDAQARLSRAVLLRESPDAKERASATAEFQALALQFPQNEIVHYNLALLDLSRGDVRSASEEARKSSGLRKDYLAPRLLQAEMALNALDYAAAADAAGEVLALDPNNFDARLLRAAALVGNKSYRQAGSELHELSKQQPHSVNVELELAALAVAQKDYSKAEALYRRHYQKGAADLRPLQGLLQVCVLERHPGKAQALLEEELKQRPDSRPIRLMLASFAAQQGEFDMASQQYRWLQSKEPESPQAYSALGAVYQAQGANEAALASYEKANRLAPNDPRILNSIAVLQSAGGKTQDAIATLNRQLVLDPNNPAAMNNLAFNLAEAGTDLDRALTLAERVARKFPDDPGVIDTLGWVYVKRGLNPSAIQVLRGLVKKYPKEPAYRYHLAVALLQAKQTGDAKRELLAALSNHPGQGLVEKIQANLAQCP